MANQFFGIGKVSVLTLDHEVEMPISGFLRMFFNLGSLDVDYSATNRKFFEEIERKKPDLVIITSTRKMFGGGTGLALTREIKVKFPEIKVIVLSGLATNREKAFLVGADGFVAKPFYPEIFLTEVLRVLKKKEEKS